MRAVFFRSDETLADLLSTRILVRLGVVESAFFTVDAESAALADGGFNATLRGYAQFGLMVAQGGFANDRQFVPQSWIEEMWCGGAHQKFGSPYNTLSPNGAYRRFWWLHNFDDQAFMARGVFGQLIWIDALNEVVIVKLSSWPTYLNPVSSQDAVNACVAIAKFCKR